MAPKVHGISPVNLPRRFPMPRRGSGCRPEFSPFFRPAGVGAICRDVEEIPARIYTELSSYIMRTQAPLKLQGIRLRRPRFAALAVIVLFLSFMAGCGGSKSANNTVAVVTVSPASLSMVAGQVVGLSVSAVNSSNTSVNTTFTFHSTDTSIATISPGGQVCAGVWDSIFVVCNGFDALGNTITGTATITVTAGSVTSGPVAVSVHPTITSVSVDPPAESCFSISQTHQFVAHAFNGSTEIPPDK